MGFDLFRLLVLVSGKVGVELLLRKRNAKSGERSGLNLFLRMPDNVW